MCKSYGACRLFYVKKKKKKCFSCCRYISFLFLFLLFYFGSALSMLRLNTQGNKTPAREVWPPVKGSDVTNLISDCFSSLSDRAPRSGRVTDGCQFMGSSSEAGSTKCTMTSCQVSAFSWSSFSLKRWAGITGCFASSLSWEENQRRSLSLWWERFWSVRLQRSRPVPVPLRGGCLGHEPDTISF